MGGPGSRYYKVQGRRLLICKLHIDATISSAAVHSGLDCDLSADKRRKGSDKITKMVKENSGGEAVRGLRDRGIGLGCPWAAWNIVDWKRLYGTLAVKYKKGPERRAPAGKAASGNLQSLVWHGLLLNVHHPSY